MVFLECSISQAITKFLDYQLVRKGRTATTIDTYRSTLGQFLKFAGDIDIDELTVELIDRYAESLKGCKPKTLRNKLTPIRSMVAYLYSKELISIRKESIDLPAVTEIEANFLDENEQRRLIKACDTPRKLAAVLFSICSGLRISEIVNVRSADLYDRSVVVRRGKGGKPRVSFITAECESAIKAYQATLKHETFYLFANENGGKMSRQYCARSLSIIARQAGILKKVSPHTLRHTFATNMLRAGARVEDVQQMMGHANIKTTLIYMHFTNDYLKGRYDEIMKKAQA